jgi:hypothetical protein
MRTTPTRTPGTSGCTATWRCTTARSCCSGWTKSLRARRRHTTFTWSAMTRTRSARALRSLLARLSSCPPSWPPGGHANPLFLQGGEVPGGSARWWALPVLSAFYIAPYPEKPSANQDVVFWKALSLPLPSLQRRLSARCSPEAGPPQPQQAQRSTAWCMCLQRAEVT